MTVLEEKTISSRRLYEGKMINLRIDRVMLPDGQEATREIVEHPGAVAVVPLTAEGELVLVQQYRQPIGMLTLEIPAGKLDPGEEPQRCAARELQEETGLIAGNIELIYDYFTTPGFSDERMYLFLATDLRAARSCPDADEFLEVVRLPLARAGEMAAAGEIRDAKTLIGILAALTRKV